MPHEDPGERRSGADRPDGSPAAYQALDFVKSAVQKGLDNNTLTDLGVPVMVTLTLLHLTAKPELVKVYITHAVRSITIEFSVDDSDMGKVIGKGGHTVDSLRSLAKSIAGGSEMEYRISLLEDRGSGESRRYREELPTRQGIFARGRRAP